MKGLSFFVSAEDVAYLIQYIENLGAELYYHSGERFCLENWTPDGRSLHLDAFFHGIKPKTKTSEKGYTWIVSEDCIEISSYSDFIIPGHVCCGSNMPEVQKMYRKIARYVKKEFTLIFDKVYYIGPDLYQTWKNQEISFNFHVDAESCVIPYDQFNFRELVMEMHRNGFIVIESNGDHHRDFSDPLENTADSYMIFYPGAKLRVRFSSAIYPEDWIDVPLEEGDPLYETEKKAIKGVMTTKAKQDFWCRDGETHTIHNLSDDQNSWLPAGFSVRDFGYLPGSEGVQLIHWKTKAKNEWRFLVDSRLLSQEKIKQLWEIIQEFCGNCHEK